MLIDSNRRAMTFVIFVLATLTLTLTATRTAHAQVAGPHVTGGTYTVAYTRKGTTTYLEERAATATTWITITSVNGGSGTVNHTFTNKPTGEYFYRTNVKTVGYRGIISWWISAEKRILVNGPIPSNRDSVANQMQYGYTTRQGDIDYDGRVDLFIQRTSGGSPNNGAIENVILRRLASGQFVPIVPTASQIGTASGWPLSGTKIEKTDMNLDGFVDIVLPNLGASLGGFGQIVIAPASSSALPQRVVPMDAKYTKFTTDTANWIEDPEYFINNSQLIVIPVYDYVQVCDWVHHGDWEEYVCEWQYQWLYDMYAFDVSWVDIDSYYLRYAFTQYVNGILQPIAMPGTAEGSSIDFRFFNVFGIQVMRGIFGNPCYEYDYDATFHFPCVDWSQILLRELRKLYRSRPDGRPLTAGERAAALNEGFHINEVDDVRVYGVAHRILGTVPIPEVSAPDGHIWIPTGNSIGLMWSNDYSLSDIRSFSILIHETFHVYQNRTTGCSTACMYARGAAAPLSGGYIYMPMNPNKTFVEHNIEQQAEMVQDRFRMRRCEGPLRNGPNANGAATLQLLDAKVSLVPGTPPQFCN